MRVLSLADPLTEDELAVDVLENGDRLEVTSIVQGRHRLVVALEPYLARKLALALLAAAGEGDAAARLLGQLPCGVTLAAGSGD